MLALQVRMLNVLVLSSLSILSTITTFISPLHALPTHEGIASASPPSINHPNLRREPASAGLGGALIDGLISGISASAANALEPILGGQPPTCCDSGLKTCRLNAGKSRDGHGFQACYQTGSEEVFDFDVEAMKCIINLHYTTPYKCIGIKGSECGEHYGGGLMRGQMGWLTTKGKDKENKLSERDSRTLQAAAESMKGVKIDYKKGENSAIELVVISDTNDVLSVSIDFDGHQGKGC